METVTYQSSLTEQEMKEVEERLGREPNILETAIFDAEWSEHCSYKSSKPLLKLLPTSGPRVLLGPGYDAGVIDIGDGYVVTMHIESHNHPSAIDPYGGAATGVGGILRDILCMGTRPIAVLDLLAFGRIDKSTHSLWLMKNVVNGIADYGNCTGVPTVGGEIEIDECYETNCLVDVACVGVGKKNDLVLAAARNPGDSVYLVGGRTGRDGIHGVTFASKVLTDESESQRSAVQIPDPFLKKLIIDATLEAVQTNHVSGLKDLGGGGLACGLSEMADKGGTGIESEISQVHVREERMNPVEIMISESQERMVFIVERGFEEQVCKAFDKYELPYRKIGVVTKNQNFVVKLEGQILADMPVWAVANAPILNRVASRPSYLDRLDTSEPTEPNNLSKCLLSLLSSPNIASKRWIYEQYDHEVGLRTVVKPGQGDATVLRLPNGKFLAVKTDANPKQCYLAPYHGAAGCVSEACRNVAAVGAEPAAMVDHLQFGDPGSSEVYWTFSEAVKGIADYCKHMGLPCVGGKVSFYNEDASKGVPIKPTPVACVVGLVDSYDQIRSMACKKEGEKILAVGLTKKEMGGSEYYYWVHNMLGAHAPKVDFEADKRSISLVTQASRNRLAQAIHDCSKGGLAVALAEMCIAGKMGADIDLASVPTAGNLRIDEFLFSESHSRFIVTCRASEAERLISLAKEIDAPCREIGVVKGERLIMRHRERTIVDTTVGEASTSWEKSLGRMMGE